MPATFISTDAGLVPLADNDVKAGYGGMTGRRDPGSCQFSVYRADKVSVTSALWSGGDWHWRLTAPSGVVLADCGGYHGEAECRAVIDALRSNAHKARVPLRH
jgi:uncharacterized protein YegP (UPF0339 family)